MTRRRQTGSTPSPLPSLGNQHVVDAYLVDVAIEDGVPVPRHYRERMKTTGPSIRRDLGKQAELPLAQAFLRA